MEYLSSFGPYAFVIVLLCISLGRSSYRNRELRVDFDSFKAIVANNKLLVFVFPNSFFLIKNKIGAIYNGKMIVSQYENQEQINSIDALKINLLSSFQE